MLSPVGRTLWLELLWFFLQVAISYRRLAPWDRFWEMQSPDHEDNFQSFGQCCPCFASAYIITKQRLSGYQLILQWSTWKARSGPAGGWSTRRQPCWSLNINYGVHLLVHLNILSLPGGGSLGRLWTLPAGRTLMDKILSPKARLCGFIAWPYFLFYHPTSCSVTLLPVLSSYFLGAHEMWSSVPFLPGWSHRRTPTAMLSILWGTISLLEPEAEINLLFPNLLFTTVFHHRARSATDTPNNPSLVLIPSVVPWLSHVWHDTYKIATQNKWIKL